MLAMLGSGVEGEDDWVDWVAVERTIHGRPVGRPITTAEQRSVVVTMTQAGHSVTAIASVLRCNQRKVRRWLPAEGT